MDWTAAGVIVALALGVVGLGRDWRRERATRSREASIEAEQRTQAEAVAELRREHNRLTKDQVEAMKRVAVVEERREQRANAISRTRPRVSMRLKRGDGAEVVIFNPGPDRITNVDVILGAEVVEAEWLSGARPWRPGDRSGRTACVGVGNISVDAG